LVEVDVDTNTFVMPGLDPGIHPSSQKVLSKKMDYRVKPGNDEGRAFARKPRRDRGELCLRCVLFEM
jgi:hypothetical protein